MRSKSLRKHFYSLVSSVVSLLAFGLILYAPYVSLGADLEISYPSHPSFKPGRWFSLPLEITSLDTPFKGLISLTLENDSFQYEVVLTPPAKKIYPLLLFSTTPVSCAPLLLLTHGKIIEQKEICFEVVPADKIWALLVKEGSLNTHLTMEQKRQYGSLHIGQMRPEELPRTWLAFDGYDLIFIYPSVLTQFDREQLEALKLWAMRGKKLVFLQGKDSSPLPDPFSKLLSESNLIQESMMLENRLEADFQNQDPFPGAGESLGQAMGGKIEHPLSSQVLSFQQATPGLGDIVFLSDDKVQGQIGKLALRLVKSGRLPEDPPSIQLRGEREKQAIARELLKSMDNNSSTAALSWLILGYVGVFFLLWVLLGWPKLKRRPLLWILTLFILPWLATVIILKNHLFLKNHGGPVSSRTSQFIRNFPDHELALVTKYFAFSSSGRGRSPDLYFQYPGDLREVLSLPEDDTGYTLVWKETAPGFTMPGREWYYGQQKVFLWEGFVPAEGVTDLDWEKSGG